MDREQIVSQLPKLMQRILERAESRKFKTTGPGVVGDKVYVTDGRIMARLGVARIDDNVRQAIDQADYRLPKGADTVLAWDAEGYSKEPILLDGLDLPDTTPRICSRCDGAPYETRVCSECGSEHEWECPACNGEGKVFRDTVPIEIAPGIHLGAELAAMLADAKAELFARPDAEHQPQPAIVRAPPLRFKCPDGVEGLVMRMKVGVKDNQK